jgi:hypothetical protein
MNNIFLRDIIESDIPIFYQQQPDPEATARAAISRIPIESKTT